MSYVRLPMGIEEPVLPADVTDPWTEQLYFTRQRYLSWLLRYLDTVHCSAVESEAVRQTLQLHVAIYAAKFLLARIRYLTTGKMIPLEALADLYYQIYQYTSTQSFTLSAGRQPLDFLKEVLDVNSDVLAIARMNARWQKGGLLDANVIAYQQFLIYNALCKETHWSAGDCMLLRREQERWFDYLTHALAVTSKEEVDALMKSRYAITKLPSTYLPGLEIPILPHVIRRQDTSVAKARWRDAAKRALAVKRDWLLACIEEKMEEKSEEKMAPLRDRQSFRIVIREGLFCQYSHYDLSLREVDTKDRCSRNKRGMAAIVMSLEGEMSLFTEDTWMHWLRHHRIHNGKPVFFAGEVEIRAGKLIAVSDYGDLYPTEAQHVQRFLQYLSARQVDLQAVQVSLGALRFQNMMTRAAAALPRHCFLAQPVRESKAEVKVEPRSTVPGGPGLW